MAKEILFGMGPLDPGVWDVQTPASAMTSRPRFAVPA